MHLFKASTVKKDVKKKILPLLPVVNWKLSELLSHLQGKKNPRKLGTVG